MIFRQPIVCVLGHVDAGKSLLLDSIRNTTLTANEAGGISQHILASEVPIPAIQSFCSKVLETNMKFTLTLPGLLFIDTPGHEAFINLRRRGGSVADIAILVIDVTKGIEAQTIEAIEILREYHTPFIIALNKIDSIEGWKSRGNNACFNDILSEQRKDVQDSLEEKIYRLVGELYKYGFSAERYDRVREFTKQILIVPVSARGGEGLQELLVLVAGLAQRFLQNRLQLHEGIAGKGSILEVREEKGLGKTLDVILFDGTIREGDEIVFASYMGVRTSRVKVLLKPSPYDRSGLQREKYQNMSELNAACGVKIVCEGAEEAIAGSTIMVVKEGEEEKARESIEHELKDILIETEDLGVIVKADTLGSIEAIDKIFASGDIPIRSASIGSPNKQDLAKASAVREKDKYLGAIFAFHVPVEEEIKQEAEKNGVKIIEEKIIYNLLENYKYWRDEETARERKDAFANLTLPAKIFLLPKSCFRVSNPAIFGVEVMQGKIRKGYGMIDSEGKFIGEIKGIQHEKENIEEAKKGMQVAISMQEPTYGRQIKEKGELYSDINTEDAKMIKEKYWSSLSQTDRELFNEILKIKGKVYF